MTYDSDTKQAIFGNRVKTAYMPKTDPFPARMLAGAKPIGPVPVITIDGMDYYHKCEFDLTENAEITANSYFDLLNGEQITLDQPWHNPTRSCLRLNPNGQDGWIAKLWLTSSKDWILYYPGATQPYEEYASSAFTVVDTLEEVTDDTKICLPTCSAYYGFLSEDGKTFISYFNLKEEA